LIAEGLQTNQLLYILIIEFQLMKLNKRADWGGEVFSPTGLKGRDDGCNAIGVVKIL